MTTTPSPSSPNRLVADAGTSSASFAIHSTRGVHDTVITEASLPNTATNGRSNTESETEDGNDALPTPEQIAAGDEVKVNDEHGKSFRFGDLRKGRKTILLFVRHQHCGICLSYLTSLNSHPAFKKLAKATAYADGPRAETAPDTQVIIISQGAWSGLKRYRDFSGPIEDATGKQNTNPFPIYASTDANLFTAYGVTRHTLAKGTKQDAAPEVRGINMFSIVLKSLKETLGSGRGILNGGSYSRLGADFIIDKDDKPIFAHRMRSTRDHTASERLAELAGLEA
ncbi:hypothetical protein K437DRAFT_257178 [Tilletiaria anomala UBC 951]|uniref:AhpC-TSA-domain-containing protein n=1 Tax=Tilletiaria anomala (strain ATCC 24038 / CBS 436.72 / UBC 951) TaxID=1037660 RepID=A0A066VRL3_TILAU|nr:uncharacterized protein K437DRAFT_257178 [Tilletiaria anomala UBC 951]KDN44136.1 hypothetical protein K437DRAFT_257178 [Tilletiaria anomala UBC 951]